MTLRHPCVQMCGLIPILIWQIVREHSQRHVIAWFIGGVCTSFAVVISMHDSKAFVPESKPALTSLCVVHALLPPFRPQSWVSSCTISNRGYKDTWFACYLWCVRRKSPVFPRRKIAVNSTPPCAGARLRGGVLARTAIQTTSYLSGDSAWLVSAAPACLCGWSVPYT